MGGLVTEHSSLKFRGVVEAEQSRYFIRLVLPSLHLDDLGEKEIAAVVEEVDREQSTIRKPANGSQPGREKEEEHQSHRLFASMRFEEESDARFTRACRIFGRIREPHLLGTLTDVENMRKIKSCRPFVDPEGFLLQRHLLLYCRWVAGRTST
jgi:hypothetical protein